jgi:SAM-dependent methyltransferase
MRRGTTDYATPAAALPVAEFYENAGLNVETYDARVEAEANDEKLSDDQRFYLGLARDSGGPVLELGCGTGRVALELANAGISVVGIDLSKAMLAVAEQKRRRLVAEAAARVRLLHADMTRFSVPERFGLAIAPFRAFAAVLDPEGQRRCLDAVRRHLRPRGRICLHLFDPRFDLLGPMDGPPPQPLAGRPMVRHPETGNRVRIEVRRRRTDPLLQHMDEVWRFTEIDRDGLTIRVEEEHLSLRWTYRWELRHLLELTGFRLEYEFSDFTGSPHVYGRELIVVARRDD